MSISRNLNQSCVALSTRTEERLPDHMNVTRAVEVSLQGRVKDLWGNVYAESLWASFARIQNLSNEFESYVRLYGNDKDAGFVCSNKTEKPSEMFKKNSCYNLADPYEKEDYRIHSSEVCIHSQEERGHLPEDSRTLSLLVDGKHNKPRNRSSRFSFRGFARSLKQSS